MLRFTTFQASLATFALFFLGYGSYRFGHERWSHFKFQQQLLEEGYLTAPPPEADQAPDQPIAKLTGQQLLDIREEMKVDINSADLEELNGLPGVGPGTAQNIIDYRKEHGPFSSIEELTNVKRIGPSLLGKIREHVTALPSQNADATAELVEPPMALVNPVEPSAPDSHATESAASDGSAASAGRIDINTASYEELQTLPKIGPSTAKAIVDYRTKNGPFRSVDELGEVPRIGEKTLENLRPRVTVGAFENAPKSQASPRSTAPQRALDKPSPRVAARASSSKELGADQKININTASEAELARLPGVGPSTAQKIVEYRVVRGRFSKIEDIMDVKGIGPSKFAKMKAHLSVQ